MESINITDIKKLPRLYEEKAELEKKIEELQKHAEGLRKAGEAETGKASAAYKRFDDAIATFRKTSEEWWKGFYQDNSREKVASRINSLNNELRQEQQTIEECNKTDNPTVVSEIDALKRELKRNSQMHSDFAEQAAYAARMAICNNVCLYVSPQGWTLKGFDDDSDWGLHLVPDGVSPTFYQKVFKITSPLAHKDLTEAAKGLPRLYGQLLDSDQSVRSIVQKHGLYSNDPAAELDLRLFDARHLKNLATKKVEQLNQKLEKQQALNALVSGGEQKFTEQRFDHHQVLLESREDYRSALNKSMAGSANYEIFKSVFDDLIANVFDYKTLEDYVKSKRKEYEQAIKDAPAEQMKALRQVEQQAAEAGNALSQTRATIKSLQDNYENILAEMTKADPASTFCYQAGGWINETDNAGHNLAVEKIKEKATGRKCLETLPVFEYLNLGGIEKPFLSETDWQTGTENAVNLIVRPLREDQSKPDAKLWAASNLITAILLSLPIRKVHFTFIDFRTDGIYSKMLSRLNAERNLYTVIHDTSQLSEVKKLYNERTQNVEEITEVIVWTDCVSDQVRTVQEALGGMMQNGARYGYYIIAVPLDNLAVSDRSKEEAERMFQAYRFREVYASGEDFNNERGGFIPKLTEYVRDGADTSKAKSIPQPSMADDSIFKRTPEEVGETGIMVPVGYDENNHQEAYWEFNVNSDFPHTFVLGGSGSGKSFLLQNILLNAMLKYRAEDLEFYLMDFKMGAAEFSNYKDMPHVSHLLIDDADHQAVYEILKELSDKMAERGRQIGSDGNIVRYNEHHRDKRLPYIVLVVDECHKLFESDAADRKMQEAINRVLASIVKEGRSQGVTLILATQTFAGMEIPSEIRNEARNKFLMRVTTNEDAEKLFNGGAVRNSALSQGYAYHDAKHSFVHIYDYRDFIEKAKETIKNRNKRPEGRNNFVFSGKDEYMLPAVDNRPERYPVALIGKSVSVKRNDITIPLRREDGSNLLITGINDEMQAERVFFSAVMSLTRQTYGDGKRVHISLIDNMGEDDDRYEYRKPFFMYLELIFGHVTIFREKGERLEEIARLGDLIREKNPQKEVNVLCILGQEKMRRLMAETLPQKMEETDEEHTAYTAATTSSGSDSVLADDLKAASGMTEKESQKAAMTADRIVLADDLKAASGMTEKESLKAAMTADRIVKPQPQRTGVARPHHSIQDELLMILKDGGESHVHVIMQVNQPTNILIDQNMVQRNYVRQWFNNIVMLKCPQDMQVKLPVDNVRLDRLSDRSDLLRAIYLNADGDTSMFTPYQFYPESN